jgi:hypothetical protein
MEPLDSSPNLSCSAVCDTNDLAMDATTNHRRRRSPPLRRGQRKHTSQVPLPTSVVRQIRGAAADQYQCLHLHPPLPSLRHNPQLPTPKTM